MYSTVSSEWARFSLVSIGHYRGNYENICKLLYLVIFSDHPSSMSACQKLNMITGSKIWIISNSQIQTLSSSSSD